jgi:hypothetical protein
MGKNGGAKRCPKVEGKKRRIFLGCILIFRLALLGVSIFCDDLRRRLQVSPLPAENLFAIQHDVATQLPHFLFGPRGVIIRFSPNAQSLKPSLRNLTRYVPAIVTSRSTFFYVHRFCSVIQFCIASPDGSTFAERHHFLVRRSRLG